MLSSSATANDNAVKRKVIANTRAGMPIQRGPIEVFSAILISYLIHSPAMSGERQRPRAWTGSGERVL